LTTHRAIEKSEVIRRQFSALADAVDALASVSGSKCGNDRGTSAPQAPSADTALPLLVSRDPGQDQGTGGERIVPPEEFFVGPGETVLRQGEIVTEFIIPKPPPTQAQLTGNTSADGMDLPIVGMLRSSLFEYQTGFSSPG